MSHINYDSHYNLLRENYYTYSVQDVNEPNLFSEIFNYDEIPKIPFNNRLVPMQMPDDIWITDTTFRDGQQAREPFTPAQILRLYELMHELSGPNGVVRQSEFFVYSKQDREALDLCIQKGFEFPEITTWIRATQSDFNLVKELGVKETGILVSCSDYHIFKKMNMTRKQAMEQYLSVVKMAIERGIKPRCHFEDITRADFYGFVVPFAHALMELSRDSGMPIKIRCCDTMGLGISYPGASLPRSVPGIIYGLRHYAGVPSEMLEWHGHNDFGKVVTNAATAWLYGASSVNCTLLGIGERTGNCPLEEMTVEYVGLRGDTNGMNLSVLTDIARCFEDEIGFKIPSQSPFMGSDFCVTRAGIHADGLMKDESIYNIFNTSLILNRPPGVIIDAHSGLAGIAYWLNTNLEKFKNGSALTKKDDIVVQMKEKIDAMYADGRTTSLSDSELNEIFNEVENLIEN